MIKKSVAILLTLATLLLAVGSDLARDNGVAPARKATTAPSQALGPTEM